MTIVEWGPELEIGITEIDYQHRNLVSMLNALHNAIDAGEPREHLGEILEELDLYVINHFATEERVMERLHFEFTAQHRLEHRDLAQAVQFHREAFARGEDSAPELLQFLINWLMTHIAGSDSLIGKAHRKQRLANQSAG
ncbi:MAG TPA: bacteriohemerythrin [Rhodocyclaceae bacterium]|nr:bacteriohemerythrin [Rhodocyclaceae bacterium]